MGPTCCCCCTTTPPSSRYPTITGRFFGSPERWRKTSRKPSREWPTDSFQSVRLTDSATTAGPMKKSRKPLKGLGKISKTRTEEHTSELQSLMRIPYDVFCL